MTHFDPTLPIDFDPDTYLDLHPDVKASGTDAAAHFLEHGYREGRIWRRIDQDNTRDRIVEQASMAASVLEIGPFYAPSLTGANVQYFDVLNSEELFVRAKNSGLPTGQIPKIDYVSPTGDLDIIDRQFDAVFSSHCIEHQPDLIRHLNQVHDRLEPGGRYYLVIPDKRYCFDHFLPVSTLEDVKAARGNTAHPTIKVIEHLAFTTHNDPLRHWRGDHAAPDHWCSILARTKRAMQTIEQAQGRYIDVHSWQFTPDSFTEIIESLSRLNLSRFKIEAVNPTPFPRLEFTALLKAT